LVNIASFEQKVPHVNSVDGKSMNRFYPGNPNGTQTERASWAMTKQVVEKSDYLIDLHGGDLDESLRPYSYQPIAPATQTPLAIWRPTPACGEAVPHGRGGPRWHRRTGRRGGADQRLPERDAHLKMLQGNAPPVQSPVWIERIASVTSETAGVFYPTVKRGWYVRQGMKIG
jgi:hypothetical protein